MAHEDLILKQVAWVLIPFIFLFAIYVLLNGETSPGGGFSGGTILGAGLILFSAAFGFRRMQGLMNRRRYSAVRTFGLLLYGVLYGLYIFIGANGLPNYLTGMILLIDLAVGLVVACTMYGFYALFSRGRDLRGGGDRNAGGYSAEPVCRDGGHPVRRRLREPDAPAEPPAEGARVQHHGRCHLSCCWPPWGILTAAWPPSWGTAASTPCTSTRSPAGWP